MRLLIEIGNSPKINHPKFANGSSVKLAPTKMEAYDKTADKNTVDNTSIHIWFKFEGYDYMDEFPHTFYRTFPSWKEAHGWADYMQQNYSGGTTRLLGYAGIKEVIDYVASSNMEVSQELLCDILNPDMYYQGKSIVSDIDVVKLIAKRLGWSHMKFSVALEAIDAIYNSIAYELLERDCAPNKIPIWAYYYISIWKDSVIFDHLYPSNKGELPLSIMRGEIEMEMANGHSYLSAIDEWYK